MLIRKTFLSDEFYLFIELTSKVTNSKSSLREPFKLVILTFCTALIGNKIRRITLKLKKFETLTFCVKS